MALYKNILIFILIINLLYISSVYAEKPVDISVNVVSENNSNDSLPMVDIEGFLTPEQKEEIRNSQNTQDIGPEINKPSLMLFNTKTNNLFLFPVIFILIILLLAGIFIYRIKHRKSGELK